MSTIKQKISTAKQKKSLYSKKKISTIKWKNLYSKIEGRLKTDSDFQEFKSDSDSKNYFLDIQQKIKNKKKYIK